MAAVLYPQSKHIANCPARKFRPSFEESTLNGVMIVAAIFASYTSTLLKPTSTPNHYKPQTQ